MSKMPDSENRAGDRLLRAASALLDVSCPLARRERVAILCDEGTDPLTAHALVNAVEERGAHAERVRWDRNRDAPSNASILDAANVLVEISQRYLFHHPSMRARIERGARYACYPQLTERYLTDSVVDADRYVEQLRRDELCARILQTSDEIVITSPHGTRLAFRLGGRAVDRAGRPARRPGQVSYLAGQVSLYPEPEGLSGVVVADRHVQGHGYPDAPVVARLDSGWLVETSGGDVAERFLHALRDYADQQVFAVSHLSLGLLPSASGEETTVAMERAPGSLVLGLGSQPPGLGVFGETAIQTEVHVDLVAGDCSVSADGRWIVKDGTFSAEELRRGETMVWDENP